MHSRPLSKPADLTGPTPTLKLMGNCLSISHDGWEGLPGLDQMARRRTDSGQPLSTKNKLPDQKRSLLYFFSVSRPFLGNS